VLIRRLGERAWREPATAAYVDEAELQRLIEESPTLLPGIDTLPAAVATEVNLGSAGFADVVVVEAEGQITLVECKLRANPEIRRAVVGQALAYAAAVWQMSYEDFDDAFARRAGAPLAAALGDGVTDWDEERFRLAVASNLQAGALRLVIAVDEITDELKRTVTFLNRHTTPAVELLAIELRRIVDHGIEVLFPQTYGEESATEKIEPNRGSRASEAGVLAAIIDRHPGKAGERMIELYTFMRDQGARLSWGRSTREPSVTAWLGEDAGNPVSVGFYPYGVAVNFDFLIDRRTDAEMARLARLVRAIPGAARHYERLEAVGFRMRPTLAPEDVLATDAALQAFTRAITDAAQPPVS
jgi:hypothetical protein